MNNSEKELNIKNIIMIIISILLIITIGTYAWLTYRSKNTAMVLTIGNINNVQITLKPYQLDLSLSPMLTYTSLDTSGDYVTVTVVNSSSREQEFRLYYDIDQIDAGLQNSNFRYTIVRQSDSNTTTGNFANANTTDELTILKAYIPNNTTYTYKVYTWLYGNNSNTPGLSFKGDLSAKIIGNATPSFIRDNAIMDNINSTYVQNSTPGIKWDEIASDTNGKGIYIRSGTENDTYPIYYYRGAVDNNNVYFGGFCWKIVRTTDTGGIKMVYNGTPTSGSCGSGTISQDSSTISVSSYNSGSTNAKYAGYTYDDNGVETNSSIKTTIDTWYEENLLASYDSYLEDTVFCNDKTTHTYDEFTSEEQTTYLMDSGNLYYSSMYRLIKKMGPSMTCANNSDAYTKSNIIGNGKLTYPVGLLTSDEIWMAGEGTQYWGSEGINYKNQTYYLYRTSGSWWSMSPAIWYGNDVNIIHMLRSNSSLGIGTTPTVSSVSIRPVVSLKSGQNFGYGNGTGANPYRFVSTVS